MSPTASQLTEEERRQASNAFCKAASVGQIEKVSHLIPIVDLTYGESLALQLACLNGHEEVVRMLISLNAYEDADLPLALLAAETQEIRDLIQTTINAPARNAMLEAVSEELSGERDTEKRRRM